MAVIHAIAVCAPRTRQHVDPCVLCLHTTQQVDLDLSLGTCSAPRPEVSPADEVCRERAALDRKAGAGDRQVQRMEDERPPYDTERVGPGRRGAACPAFV